MENTNLILTKNKVVSSVKVSLFEAAKNLNDICERIDRMETLDGIDELIKKEFSDAETKLTESIDRRKALARESQNRVVLAKSLISEIKSRIKVFEKIIESIKTTTKATIEANPGIRYEDSLGAKLSVHKNTTPTLNIDFEYTPDKTVTRIIPRSMKDKIDPKYIETISFDVLNTTKVKEDLSYGVNLDWAFLEWGSHLKGLLKT